MFIRIIRTLLLCSVPIGSVVADVPTGVIGVHVIPHSIEPTMRYRRPRDTTVAARVQLFVRGATGEPTFDGKREADLLASGKANTGFRSVAYRLLILNGTSRLFPQVDR